MENTTQTQEISRKDILRYLLDVIPDQEAEAMMKIFSYDQIHQLFTDKETRESVIECVKNNIETFKLILTILGKIPSFVQNKDEILHNYELTHYNELSRENKRKFCVEMMNQREFQRDLCDTMFDEMERQIPAMKPIIDALDIKDNFLSLYDNGGYHKYSAE